MLTLSKSRGSAGTVKGSPEDFIVREITSNGTMLVEDRQYSAADLGESANEDGKFTRFILQKRDWDTVRALINISKALGHSKQSIGYYGTKDKVAVTVQLASLFGATPEQLMQLKFKDIKINGAWRSSAAAQMGDNLGNSFCVTIRNCSNTDGIDKTMQELGNMMPNYYDRQRFGMRLNNFGIGMCIIRGDFEEAVMKFLTDTKLEKNQESIAARKRLAQELDYKKALEYFPRNLRNERYVIDYMAKYNNPANALRKIPRGILLMLVHSVQSLIFNAALEGRIRENDFKTPAYCARNFYGFPDIESIGSAGELPVASLPGYETKKELIDEYQSEFMDKIGMSEQDFKIKSMPELSTKGSLRTILSPIKDMSHTSEGGIAKVTFSIPAGAYATVLVNEITKSDSLEIQDVMKD